MSLFLILICALSFAGIITLLVWRVYAIRNLGSKELYEGVVSAPSFFGDFEKHLRPAAKSFFGKVYALTCSRKEFKLFKHHFCRVADYMNGRHKRECNGCKGYWEKLNGCKNGNAKKNTPK